MKNKDIINRIKDDSKKVEVPNLSATILCDLQNKEVFRKSEETIKEDYVFKNYFRIKPLKVFAFVLLLFLIIPATLITIDLINAGNGEIDNNPIKLNVSKTKEVVGVQAASLFGFAEQNEVSTIKTMSLTDNDYEEMSDELNQYLFSIEELMNRSNNKYELYELKEGDYKYKMIVTVDSNGLLSNYIMYFNEKTTEIYYEDIDEVSSEISGYIESGEKKYNFFGTKEVEEDECEVELKLYLDEENNDYIIASQEIEKNESEYSFKYFKDGKIVKEIDVSTEIEGDQHSVEVEVKKGNKHNGYKIKYDDENKIKVEFDYEEQSGEFYIDVYEKEYEYNFGDDKKINHGRPGHSNGGGHWDDEHHSGGDHKPDEENGPVHDNEPEKGNGNDDEHENHDREDEKDFGKK